MKFLAIPIVLFVTLAVACSVNGSAESLPTETATVPVPTAASSRAANTPTPAPTATLVPTQVPTTPGQATGDRFVLARLGIDAPIVYSQVTRTPNPKGGEDLGTMADPKKGDIVLYNDFSLWPGNGGTPGVGGNSVFSGYVNQGMVFGRIQEIAVGDLIEVFIGNQRFAYSVVKNEVISNFDTVFKSTSLEILTIVGSANGDTRPVVTARRIND